MNKHKLLSLAIALSFMCGALGALPAGAVDDETVNGAITVTGDEDPSTDTSEVYSESETVTTGESETVTTSETEGTESADDGCDESADKDCQSRPESYDTELENALDEGLANEPEVICATGDEPGCEEEADPEMWPLYLSLGALGATIILVIIINLVGRRKK